MSPSRRLIFSVNPFWPHYAAFAVILFGVFVGLAQLLLDRQDPLHCNALLNEGTWLDGNYQNWQPEGCMVHTYKPNEASSCLTSRRVVFIGDSVTRKLFFQFANTIDSKLPTAPSDNEQMHVDHTLYSAAETRLDFFWDPYLNTSHIDDLTNPKSLPSQRPALLVLGSGLWYLRYSNSSGGLSAWEAKVASTIKSLTRAHSRPADEIVFLPVEEVIPSKLSRERSSSMRLSDIEAMNSDLFHRIHPPSLDRLGFWGNIPSLPISLPLVFNQMLDPLQTEDGLHFSDPIVRTQAKILLNLRCNEVLLKNFPLDTTCCRGYPWPNSLQLILLGLAVLWGPCNWLLSRQLEQKTAGAPLISDEQIPSLIFSAAVALIFAADRTDFWLKEHKQFNPWNFAFLTLAALTIGLVTVKRADNDLGFMNRDQTDEWKGWMQIAILIYHYLGASKISGIYNPIRALVAAYLFMTGYGHTTFYVKKADFGFLRVAQVMVRLNLLTTLLAYTMNTDYISYYFAPLVSMWYLVIYGTMAIGSQFNDRTPFLVCKILISMATLTWFMGEPWLLERLFEFLNHICNIRWSAREWSFRVNLDLWVVYFGMFTALVVIKIREHRLTDHRHWPLVNKAAVILSGVVLLWFFTFELLQESKFTYNAWHPYISFLPITAFVILRNANAILRSASSRVFSFIGKCSLETFIIQFHLWLAGDTKGVLLVLPGTRWRPMNFVITTIMFIYVSHRVAQASEIITTWICGGGAPKSLPITNSPPDHRNNNTEELAPLNRSNQRKDNEGHSLPPEHDTPIRPNRRWVDRLADGAPQPPSSLPSSGFRLWYGENEWRPGVKTKLALVFGLMWLVNILWSYPGT